MPLSGNQAIFVVSRQKAGCGKRSISWDVFGERDGARMEWNATVKFVEVWRAFCPDLEFLSAYSIVNKDCVKHAINQAHRILS